MELHPNTLLFIVYRITIDFSSILQDTSVYFRIPALKKIVYYAFLE